MEKFIAVVIITALILTGCGSGKRESKSTTINKPKVTKETFQMISYGESIVTIHRTKTGGFLKQVDNTITYYPDKNNSSCMVVSFLQKSSDIVTNMLKQDSNNAIVKVSDNLVVVCSFSDVKDKDKDKLVSLVNIV